MALSFIGGATATGDSGADPSANLPGGVAENDVVYVSVAAQDEAVLADIAMGMVTSGYTELTEIYQADSVKDMNLAVYRKVMGASPDSTAVFSNPATTDAALALHVWRGANITTPEDATTTTASALNSGTPNPPSITTVTANAVVLAIGASTEADAVSDPPTSYENLRDTLIGLTNVMMASRFIAAPAAENPASFADVAGGNDDAWCAATVALRPFISPILTMQPLSPPSWGARA
jgi:hypothetical protein